MLEDRIQIPWKHFTLARWTITTTFFTTLDARNTLSSSTNGPNKVHSMQNETCNLIF